MDDLDRLHARLVAAVREGAPHLLQRRFRLADIPSHLVPYRLNRRELGLDRVERYERALVRLASGERGYLIADPAVQAAFRGAGSGTDAELLQRHADALVALAPQAMGAGAAGPGAIEGAPSAGQPPFPAPPIPTPDAPTPDTTAPAASLPLAPAPAPAVDASGDGRQGAAAAGAARASEVGTPGAAPAAPSFPSAHPPAPDAAPPGAVPMPFPTRPTATVSGGGCRYCGQSLPADRPVTFCPHCGQDVTRLRCPACSTELELGWRFCITCGRQVEGAATG